MEAAPLTVQNSTESRAEQAALLGYPNFAAYQLSDKMAGAPETVDAFLQPIMDASMRKAREEIADMEALAGHKIEPWDWAYYAEKVRAQKYALDETLSGIYTHKVLNPTHHLMFGFADSFRIPHSRYTTVSRKQILAEPRLKILAESGSDVWTSEV